MKKKHPVLLLEVLLAFTLLALCLSEFFLRPIHFHRKAIAQLETLECDRIAAWTFSELHEKFLKNEFRWSQIPSIKQTTAPIPLSPAPLQIPQLSARTIPRTYTLHTLREKIEGNGQIHRLVSIKIEVQKKEFSYHLILTKSPPTQM
ncbi:MAG: hypothetical protein KGJ02_07500 [Verrucomicrobiota bacterium]|nr:hypothetical protein [Verrucomicrobiota bacterium]